jgi:VanZ family protein
MTLNRFWWIVGFVLVALVVFVCLIPGRDLPSTPLNDKANHFIAHFVMCAWFAGLVPRRKWWQVFAGLAALGIGIEIAQGLMHEGRQSDPLDVVANCTGALVALGASWLGLARWPELAAWVLRRKAG